MIDKTEEMVVVPEAGKCIGCKKCELACMAARHSLTLKEVLKLRKELEPCVHVVKIENRKLPVQCRQCANAPCAAVCPTQAMIQPDNTGGVTLRAEYCAGCGLCAQLCRFGAINSCQLSVDS